MSVIQYMPQAVGQMGFVYSLYDSLQRNSLVHRSLPHYKGDFRRRADRVSETRFYVQMETALGISSEGCFHFRVAPVMGLYSILVGVAITHLIITTPLLSGTILFTIIINLPKRKVKYLSTTADTCI